MTEEICPSCGHPREEHNYSDSWGGGDQDELWVNDMCRHGHDNPNIEPEDMCYCTHYDS